MGTVAQLRPGREAVTLAYATGAYLTELSRPESRGTRHQYAATLRRFRDRFGESAELAGLDGAAVRAWIEEQWGARKPATYNRAIDVFRSAYGCWQRQGWAAEDPTAPMRRRKVAPDRSRALSRADAEHLLTRDDFSLRERVLWRLLYESAARAGEVLALDIEDLDLPNRRARVVRKGGAADVIVWQSGTARLLPRLIKGRKSGPLFLTDRKARVELAAADLDAASGRARLSYRQAAAMFTAATEDLQGGPWTLHQLRHSALTHAAEDGASTSTLLAYSGHTSVRSLARYARVSPEALGNWQARRDPARRR
jgi:integrase/recombinase XerC/integrase/recombinase XerD